MITRSSLNVKLCGGGSGEIAFVDKVVRKPSRVYRRIRHPDHHGQRRSRFDPAMAGKTSHIETKERLDLSFGLISSHHRYDEINVTDPISTFCEADLDELIQYSLKKIAVAAQCLQ